MMLGTPPYLSVPPLIILAKWGSTDFITGGLLEDFYSGKRQCVLALTASNKEGVMKKTLNHPNHVAVGSNKLAVLEFCWNSLRREEYCELPQFGQESVETAQFEEKG